MAQKPRQWLVFVAGLALALCAASASLRCDDDEPIGLAPVQAQQSGPAQGPATAPTQAPTPLPAAQPTPRPTLAPSPAPRPSPRRAVKVLGVRTRPEAGGLVVEVFGDGPLTGKVRVLRRPDRILMRIAGAVLASRQRRVPVGRDSVLRVRLAQNHGEVWAVLDLDRALPYRVEGGLEHAFGVKVLDGGHAGRPAPAPAPAASKGGAVLPKVDVMFFDRDVMFEGKQYQLYPCASLMYDASDPFPLKRDFVTTLVFYDGYGAFVGNLRVLDPDGNVMAQTDSPFAFNLFNPLTDANVEHTWDITFTRKGFYKLVLSLNGEDILVHPFYVGHNDDKP